LVSAPPIDKVLIYAMWKGRLLVFEEPDFPEILLQVPGGTVEPGEAFSDAAQREFFEESGLRTTSLPHFLTSATYATIRDGTTIVHVRHFFHIALEGDFVESWTTREMSPHGSDTPILFRFFWVPIEIASDALGYEQQAALPHLSDIP
jgi:ADP-ribose pyrophosphatase YjhB (NUDIX family)